MSRIAVIDFETTGISPSQGDRATEVAIVLTENGRTVDRFQSLMNAGLYIPPFITQLTGITNAMVRAAPPASAVMAEAARFVGDTPMVAHNASFDRRYWVAELALTGVPAPQPFACTVLLSRRLYPEAPSHKLGHLVDFFQLPRTGRAHRALADAEMAAELLQRIQHDLRTRHGVAEPDHRFLCSLQACARATLPKFLARATAAPPSCAATGVCP
ncbi:MAG: 3'-5' exonuclease [Hydrogenophaga sp.]|uniref:3'-5' exonuclease n=1 Tax=Hydrogenophaga sp. TaxID=1904254 RepID=UPI00276E5E9E|nr:3'-5' exonuclease [Hydrogenophaga sp.]MDP2418117.1 3'-5' exonuclease [Hydrogenophaga sp.]MDZ4190262.1 3'-5' exonuclease [Hydrogenophaga sp.]